MSRDAPPHHPGSRDAAGSAGAQATISFVLRMRSSGINDVRVLRALETVPRENFVPHRYADLALRDVSLPIGCGQSMPEPFFLARMMEALALEPQHRVLEIGTGSGYATAVFARLAAEVLSIERYRTLAIEARLRLERLGVTNAAVVWADGLGLPADAGLFDRIVLHGAVPELPPNIVAALAEDGRVVFGRLAEGGGSRLMRFAHVGGTAFSEEDLGACRLAALVGGLPQEL